MTGLTILACQIDVPLTTTVVERDRHLDRVAAKIRAKLKQRRHDLVVLPELSSIDYSKASFDKLDVLAEPLDGPSLRKFGAVAREFGVTIVYGMPRCEGGKRFISQIVVDANGEPIGHFDKLHLAQFGGSMEKTYFSPGDHLLVFELNELTIAPIICYDIRPPELTRTLAVDHGVEVVLHCSAFYRDETFYSWHHFSVCRAVENQIFFLSLNRAGENYGNSLFCTPWMDENNQGLRFPQTAEKLQSIEVDANLIRGVRKNIPLLDDRIDDYSSLPSGLHPPAR